MLSDVEQTTAAAPKLENLRPVLKLTSVRHTQGFHFLSQCQTLLSVLRRVPEKNSPTRHQAMYTGDDLDELSQDRASPLVPQPRCEFRRGTVEHPADFWRILETELPVDTDKAVLGTSELRTKRGTH